MDYCLRNVGGFEWKAWLLGQNDNSHKIATNRIMAN